MLGGGLGREGNWTVPVETILGQECTCCIWGWEVGVTGWWVGLIDPLLDHNYIIIKHEVINISYR